MKPICLWLTQGSASDAIFNLYSLQNNPIVVLSPNPEAFKHNPYVEKSYKTDNVDLDYFREHYKMFQDTGVPDTRKKLLIITPHLSTGGAPQVTVNKIELIKDEFNIKVVEYEFAAWNYVVQRNRIIQLIGNENLVSLGNNKAAGLAEMIEFFQPDVISLEELPEMFMTPEAIEVIYDDNRKYTVLETTHDSSFNTKHKRFFPDKFIFVSPYSAFKYAHLDVPTEIIEYPIDQRTRDKHAMQSKIGLDSSYKHVTIVGLFTPRKNQAYAFELARKLKGHKIKFNFLGNYADNFKSYWEPLMKDKPDNCVLWGERDDVPDFLQASDMFLFCSKGDRSNKELNPIAIKEAMEYSDVVKLMYDLDVYCGKYRDFDNVHHLTGDIDKDTSTLTESLNITKIEQELVIIGTYPNLKERVRLTKECINSLKPLGKKIMLVSHYPVDADIQRMVDYYVYDGHNPLTHHSYYTKFYYHAHDYDVDININGLKDTNQSLTVLTNLFNAFKAAKQFGYTRVFYTTYDVIVDNRDLGAIEDSFASGKPGYFGLLNTPFGKGIETTAMTMDVDFFLNTFHDTRDAQEYNSICESIGAQNFLEEYMAKVVDKKDVTLIDSPEETFLKHSGRGVASNSEYYSILPIVLKPNNYMFYFYTYNIDNRVINVTIGDVMFKIDIAKHREYKHEFEFKGAPIDVCMEFYDGDHLYKQDKYTVSNDTLDKFKHTGSFKWKNVKPRIKVVHIQTTRDDEREQLSRESIQRVKDYGWEYVLHQNEPYKSLPPAHTCLRPECVSMELFDNEKANQIGTALTPPHYGCFEAFKLAVLTEFHDCDFLMICEGDCLIESDLQEFITVVETNCQTILDYCIGYMSFGDKALLEQGWVQSPVVRDVNETMYITDKIIGIQCIMFPIGAASYLKEQFRTQKWDAADYFFNRVFQNSPWELGIVHNRLTTQADGFSLIDQTNKTFIKK